MSETLRVNDSKTLRIKNAKFSGNYFYMNTNILGDFQICSNVPLRNKIIDMRIILQDLELSYFVLRKTKLDKKFSYQPISLKWVQN